MQSRKLLKQPLFYYKFLPLQPAPSGGLFFCAHIPPPPIHKVIHNQFAIPLILL